MPRKVLIICVDGLGPDYLHKSPSPNLDRMAAEGSFQIGQSVIPSVTNVNNVSIITGKPPSVHGITSNYYLDHTTGRESYMESAEYVLCPTVLQRARAQGMSTALLTAKQKLLRLLDTGADYSLSAEKPDKQMIREIGPAQDIYSPDINPWLFRALRLVLQERNPDVAYCSTTDGMMHKYAPDQEESIRHIQALDSILGEIIDDNTDREVYLTADHGMSAKSRGVDLEKALRSEGIEARAIPIIKDRYVAHHQNLGGASYIYLQDESLGEEALGILQSCVGVEAAYHCEAAARRFDLMADRIGDLFVLGDQQTVFGQFETVEVPVAVRSHGSLHESAVPIIMYGSRTEHTYHRNFDIVGQLGID